MWVHLLKMLRELSVVKMPTVRNILISETGNLLVF